MMNPKPHPYRQLQTISILILTLWMLCLDTEACELTPTVTVASVEDIETYFTNQKKKVVTFLGFSGAEYKDKAAMLETAERFLDGFDSSKTIINIGGTPEGIGAVYQLAKHKGFYTTGIVSTQAKEYNFELSPCVDYVFYVEDVFWGGLIEGSNLLSPTSAAIVESSDVLIGIGGGKIARDELLAAKRSGKEVHFIPADMNHQKARREAQNKGLPEPTNFEGAAGESF